jgi:hypothetical protein
MIVVRNTFQLKFGKSSEAVAHWRKGWPMLQKATNAKIRLLTDVTGQFYTLVMEMEFKSLADYEKGHSSVAGSAAWKSWYKKFSALVESGHREIFKVVD